MKKSGKWSETCSVLRLLWTCEPRYLLTFIPQVLLSSLFDVLLVYFPKLFIEQLESGKAYSDIALAIGLYIAVTFAIRTLGAWLGSKNALYMERFSRSIQMQAGKITMALPLSDMEGAKFSDKLAMANNATGIADALDILRRIFSNALTILSLSVIVTRLDAVFILTVSAVLGLKVWFVWLTYRYREKRRKAYAANNRKGNYLDGMAYFNPGAAKEIRINKIEPWFMSKVTDFREEMLGLQYGDFGRNTLFECISAVIMAVQSFVILYVLSGKVFAGTIGIADFTMFFSAVTKLSVALSAIVSDIGEYNRKRLYVSDFLSLRKQETPTRTKDTPAPGQTDIVFENVSFRYPNTETFVLKNINIRIPTGETLSVVGKNGAGKSTFIKLICRFYRPTEGRITVGGVDIHEIGDAEYNALISAVFQDYQNFSLTLRENVLLGKQEEDLAGLMEDVGLSDLVSRLPNGMDTYLLRRFDSDGVELSGGEGQKLAIARAVYKNAPILILDEPTAALDPKAESEIYERYFNIAKNKTTIFISHRLASTTFTDKIALFDNGEILEYGTHEELMRQNAMYATLFRIQSSAYQVNS